MTIKRAFNLVLYLFLTINITGCQSSLMPATSRERNIISGNSRNLLSNSQNSQSGFSASSSLRPSNQAGGSPDILKIADTLSRNNNNRSQPPELPRNSFLSYKVSSSPVEPIKPLLNLGSSSSGGLTLPPHPVFDDAAPDNISGLHQNTVYLHCLVHNLGNKSVSWIRQRDLHILTVDRYTYTTDDRYEVLHSSGSKDWILKIKYAQVRDTGKYECQVSTKPVRSYIVNLNVYAPKAEIIGSPDMHVDRGSTINLTCVIEHSPQPPAYIFWYHNGKVVNYDSPRGGITVVTERGNTTRGYLLIQDAKSSDSGNYSCEPSNTGASTLRVHVLDGELPAAMQTSGGEVRPQNHVHIICFFFVSYIFHLRIEKSILNCWKT